MTSSWFVAILFRSFLCTCICVIQHCPLNLNVRGPSYLGLTRSISWLLMPWFLRRQDISSHDIDYIEYVGPSLTWGSVQSTCVKSMWRNDIKCKYMFMLPQKQFARKGLMPLCFVIVKHRESLCNRQRDWFCWQIPETNVILYKYTSCLTLALPERLGTIMNMIALPGSLFNCL